ncbi:hypothetical protein [Litorihabitans aurantiacus]|uniref:Uncharacterized protein n=1 Tax=Litorihabitans aurantiacus TaxID=1930061 RepID=A0AA38CS55_9MICO|nr:hypothetical protein [Litorihabitans aurantiacus]GMA32231.1 hypothetical protein GCM10025875_22230 [Litorihabitans aurantiacus]
MRSAWIEHRRPGDRELLGWMEPVGEDFVVVDLLGRRRTGPVDWLTAEETLDALGISYLADPYELRREDGTWLRVLIVEVSADGLRVKKDDWGDMTAPQVYFSVAFPVEEGVLRPTG